MVHGRNRVLPDEFFLRHFRSEIACAWAHVAVSEFEPSARESVGELVRVFEEAARDLLVGRVEAKRKIRRQHCGGAALRFVMCVGHGARTRAVLRLPLVCAGGALRQLPLETKQAFEELVAPLGGLGGPGDFQSAGDRISRPTCAERALPTEALRFDLATLRLGTDVLSSTRAVGFAKGVAASDQRDGLFVIHRHSTEGLANVARRGDGVRFAVRALRIHVDEAHLHGPQRIGEFSLAGVTRVSA
jgi:hypothetical protein